MNLDFLKKVNNYGDEQKQAPTVPPVNNEMASEVKQPQLEPSTNPPVYDDTLVIPSVNNEMTSKVKQPKLELSTNPPKGTIFNRRMVIITSGVLIGSMLLAAAWSLAAPQKRTKLKDKTEKSQSAMAVPDALKDTPSSYNDLNGKAKNKSNQPTEENNQHNKTMTQPPIQNRYNPYNNKGMAPSGSAVSMEQKELMAAQKSPLRFSGITSAKAEAAPNSNQNNQSQAKASVDQFGAGNIPNDPNGQYEKQEFVEKNRGANFYARSGLQEALSEFEIKAGTIIPGVMISGIDSDLPGAITAQVRENVYDTVTGNYLLIPQGAKLIGNYDSKVTYGQKKVLVVWTRLIMPNGESLNLESMQGYDQGGYSGFQDKVDNHTGRIVTGILVSGFLGALDSLFSNDDSTTINFGSSAADSASSIGEKMADKALNVQPTVKITPGYRFNVMVTKDFILHPYEG